jgi:hypothetical protein
MNAALELHDSDVEAIVATADEIRIVFSNAYVHRSNGRPGIDVGSGYIQPATIVLSGVTASTAKRAGTISDGALIVKGNSMSLIPLPFAATGQMNLRLFFVSGEEFSASATSVACSTSGEPRYVESYARK